jgi:hypothetical protein
LSQKGPETLGVRTGNLRRSIQRTNAVVSGNQLVSAIGSNIKYLRPHEFGMDEKVTVAPSMRKHKAKEVIFGRRRVVRKGDIAVRSHQRHMKFPARAPLRRGIFNHLGAYGTALEQGIVRFYAGKK